MKKLLCLGFLLFSISANALAADPREESAGFEIYKNGYIDQPYILKLPDSSWFCVFTTSTGVEGSNQQHIVAAFSKDMGKTWSAPKAIEESGESVSSWGIPFLTDYGRIYVFYDFDGDKVKSPEGKEIRSDMLGWYCYRFSDDFGKTWSERHRLPVRLTSSDIQNQWGGKVQMFWGIDKPTNINNAIYFSFTKMGEYISEKGEGWLFKCDNINTEKDAHKLNWQMLPDGDDRGIYAPEIGSTQEEHNIVPMNDGKSICCIFRTAKGYMGQSYSRDLGKTWSLPQAARYDPQSPRTIKNPRACPQMFKCQNNKYLIWYHNNNGRDWSNRNPAWIAGGVEKDGAIHWSEPEILLYSNRVGAIFSYPDLIEDGGRYFVSETEKVKARIHEIDPTLLEGLWNQKTNAEVVKDGLVAESRDFKKPIDLKAIPNLNGGGFALEFALKSKNLNEGDLIFDNTDKSGKGVKISIADYNRLKIILSDGKTSDSWCTDINSFSPDTLCHVVIIVDGAPKIVTAIVDGKLLDGDGLRKFGWWRFNKNIGDTSGTSARIGSKNVEVKLFRFYDRYLRTSEAIANYNNFKAQK